MWNPLDLLGASIFVEAEAVVEPRMEGNDATALIEARMGIDQTEVGSRLVSLHQKGELDGTADGTDGGTPARVEGGANNISLTSKNLEEFERSESEGMITGGTPHKLKLTMRPSILTPGAAAPPPAASEPSPPSKWHEDMEATTGVDEVAMEPEEDMAYGVREKTTGVDAVAVAMEPEEDMAYRVREKTTSVDAVSTMEPKEDMTYGVRGVEDEVRPEPRRYGEAVEAENIYGGLAAIDVPTIGNESTVGELQCVVQELVAQVNVANKALATAVYIIAGRSQEAMQQAKIGSDMATEALLKAYEVAAVAASSSRQSWKMCVQMAGPDMPPRTKDGERKPETTGRYLASTLFGVHLRQEEVAIYEQKAKN
jgi:hypothetical protein